MVMEVLLIITNKVNLYFKPVYKNIFIRRYTIMIKNKICSLFSIMCVFFSCVFITQSVQASNLKPYQVQVFTQSNNICKKPCSTIVNLQDNTFNPLMASNKDLISHGYPPRPQTKQDLTEWKKAVSVKLIKPNLVPTSIPGHNSKSFIKSDNLKNTKSQLTNEASTPNATINSSRNWCGYEVDTNAAGSQGSWKVPYVSAISSEYQPAYSSQWNGIGGGYGDPNSSLIQAGDSARVLSDGSTNYFLWFELFNTSYSDGHPVTITNLACFPSDNIYTSVQTTYSSGNTATFTFFVANTTAGQGVTQSVTVNDNRDSNACAEWISETNTGFYNPKTTTQGGAYTAFWASEYQTSIGGNFIGISNNTNGLRKIMLVNKHSSGSIPVTGHLLSNPTDLSGSSFNINWYNYY